MGIRYLDDEPQQKRVRYLDDVQQPTQEDAARKVLEETPWLERQLASAGGALQKGIEGVKGAIGMEVDPEVAKYADIAAQEAPVGAFVGEMAKYAPLLPITGIKGAMAAGAGLGALYDPTGNRLGSGVTEGLFSGAGAALGKALPVVAGKTANVANYIQEKLGGAATPKYYGGLDKAREALRKIIGEGNIPAATAALGQAGDVRTAQALVDALPTSSAENIAVLDRLARKEGISAATDPLASAAAYAEQRARQQAGREATMATMARGGTEEQTQASIREFMKQAEQELGPRRSVFLAQLAYGGDEAARILPQLNALEQRYVSALQNQGRMMAEAGSAISPVTARGGVVPDAAQVAMQGERVPGAVKALGEQAKLIDERGFQQFQNAASQFGDIATESRVAADALRQQLSELPAPFTAAPVRDAVSRMATSSVNPQERAVLGRVAEELARAGDDPVKIAAIRKLGVNQLIGDLVDAGTLAKGDAAASLQRVKKVIDQQLGSDMVNKYFKPYSDKLAFRDSLEAMSELRRMQAESPKRFMKTVQGDNKEFMEKYGIESMMDFFGKRRMESLSKVAGELRTDRTLKELSQSSEAKTAIAETLGVNKLERYLPNMLNRYVVLANEAMKAGKLKMDASMYREIEKAMRDPKAMENLITMLPPEQRSKMVGFMNTLGKGGGMVGAAEGERIRK